VEKPCVSPSRRRKRGADDEDDEDDEEEPPLVDIFLNPARREEIQSLGGGMRNTTTSYFSSPAFSTAYPNLFKLLWYSSLPCHRLPGINSANLLRKCQLHGKEVDCKRIFETRPTDMGLCCAFNAKDSLKTSEYSTLVRNMQAKDRTMLNISEREDEVARARVGRGQGLRLTLDLNSNWVSHGTLASDKQAALVVLGGPRDFPSLRVSNLLVAPGRETWVEVTPLVVTSHPSLASLSPTSRGCLLPHESALDHHAAYSVSSCRLECGLARAEAEVNCVPWALPRGPGVKVCDPWLALNFSLALALGGEPSCLASCLPDCQAVDYTIASTEALFRRCDSRNLNMSPLCDLDNIQEPAKWTELASAEYKSSRPNYLPSSPMRSPLPSPALEKGEILVQSLEPYDAFDNDIAVLSIYFGSPTTVEFQRSLRMTIVDFIGSVGGLFGLCLGFSLISFFELLYWFLVITARRWRSSKSRPGTRRLRARSIPGEIISPPASAKEITDIIDDISVADITEDAADITEEEKAVPDQQSTVAPSITDSSWITDSASITDSLDITDNPQITDTSLITDTT